MTDPDQLDLLCINTTHSFDQCCSKGKGDFALEISSRKALKGLNRSSNLEFGSDNAPVLGIERSGRHEQRAHSVQL
jgi:hypothetical protein